jgi:hypothetical protein
VRGEKTGGRERTTNEAIWEDPIQLGAGRLDSQDEPVQTYPRRHCHRRRRGSCLCRRDKRGELPEAATTVSAAAAAAPLDLA